MPAKRDTLPKSAVDPLNRRQRLFVTAYLAGATKGNGTRSAMAAGYSEKSAHAHATWLLQHPVIKREIAQVQGALQDQLRTDVTEILDQFTLSRAKVLRQVGIGAFADMRGFYDKHGELIPIHKLPYEQACLIEGIEHIPVYEGAGREKVQVGTKTVYKLAKRAPFVDMAMKHLGEYKKDNEQGAKALVGSLAELVAGAKGSTLPIGGGSTVNVDSADEARTVNVDTPNSRSVALLGGRATISGPGTVNVDTGEG